MTKALLEQIEKELAELNPGAMSFDHEEAEQCKAALVRIVEKAADISRQISNAPARTKQTTGWKADHDAAIRAARRDMPRPRRVISVAKDNLND